MNYWSWTNMFRSLLHPKLAKTLHIYLPPYIHLKPALPMKDIVARYEFFFADFYSKHYRYFLPSKLWPPELNLAASLISHKASISGQFQTFKYSPKLCQVHSSSSRGSMGFSFGKLPALPNLNILRQKRFGRVEEDWTILYKYFVDFWSRWRENCILNGIILSF